MDVAKKKEIDLLVEYHFNLLRDKYLPSNHALAQGIVNEGELRLFAYYATMIDYAKLMVPLSVPVTDEELLRVDNLALDMMAHSRDENRDSLAEILEDIRIKVNVVRSHLIDEDILGNHHLEN